MPKCKALTELAVNGLIRFWDLKVKKGQGYTKVKVTTVDAAPPQVASSFSLVIDTNRHTFTRRRLGRRRDTEEETMDER